MFKQACKSLYNYTKPCSVVCLSFILQICKPVAAEDVRNRSNGH